MRPVSYQTALPRFNNKEPYELRATVAPTERSQIAESLALAEEIDTALRSPLTLQWITVSSDKDIACHNSSLDLNSVESTA